jgi:hypothetical protein
MIHTRFQSFRWVLFGFLAFLWMAPPRLTLFTWDGQGLVEAQAYPKGISIPTTPSVDLNKDGQPETVDLQEGKVEILSQGIPVWSSPTDWNVVQSEITDLNHDGNPEVTLLLWREFKPWPIDAFIPHPGRIGDFHDHENQSCHLILIGWSQGAYHELWAGSALANPLLAFSVFDINRDGRQEMAVLESRYDAHFLETSRITIWEWNGFGFTLLSRGPEGYFHSITTVKTTLGQGLLLAQGILRR